jgi:hypothetical protein
MLQLQIVMKKIKNIALVSFMSLILIAGLFSFSATVGAASGSNKVSPKFQCGNLSDDDKNTKTVIDFGCLGKKGPTGMGPIEDFLYAVIRFLTNGIGVMMVLAVIGAGIQYTMSEGSAETTMKAKKRITNIVLAAFVYLFIYAILQFLVPGGLFG